MFIYCEEIKPNQSTKKTATLLIVCSMYHKIIQTGYSIVTLQCPMATAMLRGGHRYFRNKTIFVSVVGSGLSGNVGCNVYGQGYDFVFRHATWYRLRVSDTDLGLFWDDTDVLNFDTDWRQIMENILLELFF